MQYTEWLTQFFANQITGSDQKWAVLLSVIGSKFYRFLKSLITPERPANKKYKGIVYTVNLLKNHFNPKPSQIQYKFFACKRKMVSQLLQ